MFFCGREGRKAGQWTWDVFTVVTVIALSELWPHFGALNAAPADGTTFIFILSLDLEN
jgi:hypothetical protein